MFLLLVPLLTAATLSPASAGQCSSPAFTLLHIRSVTKAIEQLRRRALPTDHLCVACRKVAVLRTVSVEGFK